MLTPTYAAGSGGGAASSDSAADTLRAAAAAKADAGRKRLATLQAVLALRGYELREAASGGWLVVRWGLTRPLADLAAVEQFVAMAAPV